MYFSSDKIWFFHYSNYYVTSNFTSISNDNDMSTSFFVIYMSRIIKYTKILRFLLNITSLAIVDKSTDNQYMIAASLSHIPNNYTTLVIITALDGM